MKTETTEQSNAKILTPSEVINSLQKLKRWDANIAGGCDCCGSWVEHEACKDGEWVKFDDIKAIIERLQSNQ